MTGINRESSSFGREGDHRAAPSEAALLTIARLETRALLARLGSSANGLTDAEAAVRLDKRVPAKTTVAQLRDAGHALMRAVLWPCNLAALALGAISLHQGHGGATAILWLLFVLSVARRLYVAQVKRRTADELERRSRTTARVQRVTDGAAGMARRMEKTRKSP